jgi:hypothetical protein
MTPTTRLQLKRTRVIIVLVSKVLLNILNFERFFFFFFIVDYLEPPSTFLKALR